ncbi:MAG TPA: tetraacyldisaccharide 4'-kinase [Gillisia sp.]|nr:tetraacyldisaccharide 4'-kinase [Gillisia sp.]
MSKLRKILLPFSLLYGGVMAVRNILYDRGILESSSFSTPVICVGNLSVGGTGKTPMIEYLLQLLLPKYRLATLSRGYGRKTKGYLELKGNEQAEQVGDEPLQFKVKFPQVHITVDEDRRNGITHLISAHQPDIILLDDAFQHRKVKSGLNILLTAYNSIYAEDFVLPAGNLREPRSGASRAKIIVVTKCPVDLSFEKQEQIRKKLRLEKDQNLHYSYIKYAEEVKNEETGVSLEALKEQRFTLVTGIAKPDSLITFLKAKGLDFDHLKFPDHHNFTTKDLEKISKAPFVLTTEKDYMRLKDLKHSKLFYIPIKMDFLNSNRAFDEEVLSFLHEK